jgi:hypothetical protein
MKTRINPAQDPLQCELTAPPRRAKRDSRKANGERTAKPRKKNGHAAAETAAEGDAIAASATSMARPRSRPPRVGRTDRALEQFRPEFEPDTIDAASENRNGDTHHGDGPPPLLVVHKAAMPLPTVVEIPTTTTPELLMMRLRDVQTFGDSLKAKMKTAWAARRPPGWIRRPTHARSGPPVWLVGCLACIAVPAVITPSFSGTPGSATEQRDVETSAQPPVNAPKFYAKLPLRLEVTQPPPIVPATPSAAPVRQPARASVSIARPAPTQQARAAVERPAAAKPPATSRGFQGTLVVHSEPAGATVYVDQRRVGETPIEIPRLRAGSHAVWVEIEGYVRWTAGVLVRYNSVTRLAPTLERKADR